MKQKASGLLFEGPLQHPCSNASFRVAEADLGLRLSPAIKGGAVGKNINNIKEAAVAAATAVSAAAAEAVAGIAGQEQEVKILGALEAYNIGSETAIHEPFHPSMHACIRRY